MLPCVPRTSGRALLRGSLAQAELVDVITGPAAHRASYPPTHAVELPEDAATGHGGALSGSGSCLGSVLSARRLASDFMVVATLDIHLDLSVGSYIDQDACIAQAHPPFPFIQLL